MRLKIISFCMFTVFTVLISDYGLCYDGRKSKLEVQPQVEKPQQEVQGTVESPMEPPQSGETFHKTEIEEPSGGIRQREDIDEDQSPAVPYPLEGFLGIFQSGKRPEKLKPSPSSKEHMYYAEREETEEGVRGLEQRAEKLERYARLAREEAQRAQAAAETARRNAEIDRTILEFDRQHTPGNIENYERRAAEHRGRRDELEGILTYLQREIEEAERRNEGDSEYVRNLRELQRSILMQALEEASAASRARDGASELRRVSRSAERMAADSESNAQEAKERAREARERADLAEHHAREFRRAAEEARRRLEEQNR